MSQYRIEDAKKEIKNIMTEIGATEFKDTSINRVFEMELESNPYVVICYPIVLRSEDLQKKVPEQRYIDINSSGWDEAVSLWKKACIQNKKSLVLAIRHVDDIVGNVIFSVEGDLSKFPNKSIYLIEEYLSDIKNERIGNMKEYALENHPGGKLCILKKNYLNKYLQLHENIASVDTFQKAISDYSVKFGDENISIVETTSAPEGKRIAYYTTKYERSAANRKAAIEKHGTKCFGCGFDFESKYGERGRGFIEIHHTKPLYEMDGETVIDPETDLVPVCSNCHRMIHKKKNAILTVEELRKIIAENDN